MADQTAAEDNIKVVARVRPVTGTASKLAVSVPSSTKLLVGGQTFNFDHVAGTNASQEEVFDVAGKGIADSCLAGINGTIFAYGQTGSGKTFTIHGPNDAPDVSSAQGLLPRTLDYVFSSMRDAEAASEGKISYTCRVSFLEIYNERVYDLLDFSTPMTTKDLGAQAAGPDGLDIRETKVKGVLTTFVEGLLELPVSTSSEAHALMLKGTKNRTTAATAMNHESSRSHSVFTLVIESTTREGRVTKSRTARFNLIDLAGSERQKLTKVAGEQLKEAGQINKSLSALGGVIHALVDISTGKQRHVHYRDSKLTMLLRDSLGGNSKTVLIAAVAPTEDCFSETLSTLKFAARAKLVKNKAMVNEDIGGSIADLQAEVRKLREELELYQSGALGAVVLPSGSATKGLAGTGAGANPSTPATPGAPRSLVFSPRTNTPIKAISAEAAAAAFKQGDSLLAAWDSAIVSSIKGAAAVRAGSAFPADSYDKVSTADAKSIISMISKASQDKCGEMPVVGVSALAALAHIHREMSDKGRTSISLLAAGSAQARLVDLEKQIVSCRTELIESEEDRDALEADYDTRIAKLQSERAELQLALEKQQEVTRAIQSAWDQLQQSQAAESQSSATVAEPEPTPAPAPEPLSKLEQMRMKQFGSRRTSHTAATMGAAAAAATTAATASRSGAGAAAQRTVGTAGPAGPSSSASRRGSVSSLSSSTTASSTFSTTRKPMAPEPTHATNRGGSVGPASSLSRRPSITSATASAAATAAAAATAVLASLSPREEFAKMLDGLRAAYDSLASASTDAQRLELEFENKRLRERLSAYEPIEGASRPVRIEKAAFKSLVDEIACRQKELDHMRTLFAEQCSPQRVLEATAKVAAEKDQQIASLQTELSNLDADFRQFRETVRNKFEKAQRNIDEEVASRNNVERAVAELNARIAEADVTIAELQAEVESRDSEVVALRDQAASFSAARAQLESEVTTLRATSGAAMRQEAAKSSETIKMLRQQLESAVSKAARFESELSVSAASTAAAEVRASEAEAGLAALTHELNAANETKLSLERDLDDMWTQLNDARSGFSAAGAEVDQLRSSHASAQSRVKALEAAIHSKESALNNIQAQLNDALRTIDTQRQDAQHAAAEIEQVAADRDHFAAQADELSQQLQQSQSELQRLQSQAPAERIVRVVEVDTAALSAAEGRISMLEGELQATQQRMQSMQGRLGEVERDNEQLLSKLESLSSASEVEIQRLQEVIDQKTEAIFELEAQIADLKARLDAAAAAAASSAQPADNGATAKALRSAHAELSKVRGQLTAAQAAEQAAKAELDAAVAEVEGKNQEVRRLKEDLDAAISKQATAIIAPAAVAATVNAAAPAPSTVLSAPAHAASPPMPVHAPLPQPSAAAPSVFNLPAFSSSTASTSVVPAATIKRTSSISDLQARMALALGGLSAGLAPVAAPASSATLASSTSAGPMIGVGAGSFGLPSSASASSRPKPTFALASGPVRFPAAIPDLPTLPASIAAAVASVSGTKDSMPITASAGIVRTPAAAPPPTAVKAAASRSVVSTPGLSASSAGVGPASASMAKSTIARTPATAGVGPSFAPAASTIGVATPRGASNGQQQPRVALGGIKLNANSNFNPSGSMIGSATPSAAAKLHALQAAAEAAPVNIPPAPLAAAPVAQPFAAVQAPVPAAARFRITGAVALPGMTGPFQMPASFGLSKRV